MNLPIPLTWYGGTLRPAEFENLSHRAPAAAPEIVRRTLTQIRSGAFRLPETA